MKLLYHANCADGIFAAYYASAYLNNPELIPVRYQEQLINLDNENVVCVDYCPTIEILKQIKPKSLVVIDHHVTKNNDLKDFVPDYPFSYIYDIEECGTSLVWKYFFYGHIMPWVIPYIKDRDLWRWKLPQSKEVDACIQSYSFTIENCKKIELMGVEQCVVEGESILRYQSKIIRQTVAQARETEFHGHRVMIVNSTVLQSEVGNELCKNKPFAIIWYNRDKDKQVVYSLRSDENGVNVGEIAKACGGGGHEHAASFSAPWHMEAV